MTGFLYELGQVTDSEVHIDGTKMKTSANRYTFVSALLASDIIERYAFRRLRHRGNMAYDAEEDCYQCHNGKKIKKQYEKGRKTAGGYLRIEIHYRCDECDGRPYREAYMPGKNWKKPVGERYKNLTVSKKFEELSAGKYELINSREEKKLRMNRSIQAEGSFGDIKADSAFTSFLCRGRDNVYAENVLFAMTHKLGWPHSRIQNDRLDLHLYELKERTQNRLHSLEG